MSGKGIFSCTTAFMKAWTHWPKHVPEADWWGNDMFGSFSLALQTHFPLLPSARLHGSVGVSYLLVCFLCLCLFSVSLVKTKLDPENLGVILLGPFLLEFFPDQVCVGVEMSFHWAVMWVTASHTLVEQYFGVNQKVSIWIFIFLIISLLIGKFRDSWKQPLMRSNKWGRWTESRDEELC